MKNVEIFYAKAQNSGNLSHFHGTRTLILSWMHVKRLPGNGPRKRMSNSTPFPNGSLVPAKHQITTLYTFVCKRHYVDILIEDLELGLHSLPRNPTYNLTDCSASEVLDNNKSVLTSFGIHANSEELDLPNICWIPKMHKNPYKDRFIAGSSKCSTKPLSILLTKNCLHILSKVFRSTARQPTQKVGSIRCGSSKIQKNY